MTSLRALLRRCDLALRNAHDTPARASLALAIGVFISFSPLIGLQILITAAVAWASRLNRVLLFAGLVSNLPWVMPIYYGAVTEAAARVMGRRPPSHLAAGFSALFGHSVITAEFWHELSMFVLPLLAPFVVGSFLAAGVLALVAYSLGVVVASARRFQTSQH